MVSFIRSILFATLVVCALNNLPFAYADIENGLADSDEYHSCTEGDIGFESANSSFENSSDDDEAPPPSSILGKPKAMKGKKSGGGKKPAGDKKKGAEKKKKPAADKKKGKK